jgi:transmembrane sensor
MSTVVPLRSMRNEASEWLARLQSEYATEQDRRQFEVWAGADPRRREIYAQLAGAWQRLESLSDLDNAPLQSANTVVRRRRRWIFAAAACLSVLLAGSAWVILNGRTDAFETAIGEQRRIALPDASTVELNTDSRVAIDYKQTERLIRLERGEARFKVAHQPRRPFIVDAADHLIRAVGTEFTVHVAGDQVKVMVVEGVVSFLSPAGTTRPLTVHAGHAAASSRPNVVVPVAPAELERRLAWHDGMVSFQGETLQEVVTELGRYNRVRFVVADDATANIRVSGYFRATDVPTFLARMKENFPVEVRRDAQETVIITRAAARAP